MDAAFARVWLQGQLIGSILRENEQTQIVTSRRCYKYLAIILNSSTTP